MPDPCAVRKGSLWRRFRAYRWPIPPLCMRLSSGALFGLARMRQNVAPKNRVCQGMGYLITIDAWELQPSQNKNMNISDAIVTAEEMIARLGTETAAVMDKRAHAHDAVGQWEEALFWRRVALAARLLAPSVEEGRA